MSSAVCFNLDQSKILSSGNELMHPVAKTIITLVEKTRAVTKCDLLPSPVL